MTDEPRKPELHWKTAAATTGLAALVLGGVWLCVGTDWNTRDIEAASCMALAVAVLGSAVGVVGASAPSLNRASVFGIGLAGLLVAFPIELADNSLRPAADRPWLFAALCSLGSILAQIGAVVGGVPAKRNEPSRTQQFSLGQLLGFFIPVALYCGYVSAHMQK